MKLAEVTRRAVSSKALLVKKNSPHIFFAAGIAGVVGGAVLACKATLKLEKTLEEFKQEVDDLKEFSTPGQEQNKDLAYIYAKNSMKLVKLYAPAAGVMTISIVALTGSHVTLTRRNTALMSAYSLVQAAYNNYRDRVREEVGEEKELDLYHAVTTDVVHSGTSTEIIKTANPNKFSAYARFFDAGSPSWVKDAELNRIFIQAQQKYFNHLLHARGHVFLNEVYDALGIDHSKAGAIVGWVVGGEGDNYIDFGMFEARNSQFVNGWEPNILLDFNVDGVIYDKI